MQKLVSEAISQGRDVADPAALDAQIHAYRSAALIGASQTAARSSPLIRKHHALARRLLDRQDDCLRFTRNFRVPPDNDLSVSCAQYDARPTGRWHGETYRCLIGRRLAVIAKMGRPRGGTHDELASRHPEASADHAADFRRDVGVERAFA